MRSTTARVPSILLVLFLSLGCSSSPTTDSSGTGGGSTSSSSSTPGSSGVVGPSAVASSGATASSASSGSGGGGTGTVVLFETFDGVGESSFSDSKNHDLQSGLGMGAQDGGVLRFETDAAQTYGGMGKSVKASYPIAAGGVYAWGGYDVSHYNTDNVYVRFRAKMSGNPHGLKFLKVFGQQSQDKGYANTTFGLDYTGIDNGSLQAVSFGDGTELTNDTASVVLLGGENPSWVGRSFGLPGNSVLTPQVKPFASADWGGAWHLFELHVKFNSGTSAANEKNDGEAFLRIDGKVYVDAKGLYNRNYLNQPIESVQILGWSQGGSAPFDIWYDNLEVSLGGWGDSPV